MVKHIRQKDLIIRLSWIFAGCTTDCHQTATTNHRQLSQIYWHDGDGHVLVRNVQTSSTLLGDGKRFNTTSTVTFLPKVCRSSCCQIINDNLRSVILKHGLFSEKAPQQYFYLFSIKHRR